MKYIRLFENFEEGHKFDLLDLFIINPKEIEELFFRELKRTPPDLENIQVFLDSGLVDLNAKNSVGSTPLHWAARNNRLELAKLLISSGADLNAKGTGGWTPLHWVARDNRLELAKLLISSGAEVNAKSNSDLTPLHLAAINNRLEVAELLISSGADLEAKDSWGCTPLDRANSKKMKELLQSYGGIL